MSWKTLTPLAAAALLTLAGAWRVSAAGGEGWPLLILGAVCLGAWLAINARDKE
jgi:hypothetical protein